MPSRKLSDLDPELRDLTEKFIHECSLVGVDLLVTCTYRSEAEQAELYARGRTTPGPIVTHARPGQSRHNVVDEVSKLPRARAIDVVPLRNGKCVWDVAAPEWKLVSQIGESIGLEWAGRWKRNRESAHFQLRD